MVANSRNSAGNGKQSTQKIVRITREQAAEILQASLEQYDKTGGKYILATGVTFNGKSYPIALLFTDLAYDSGNLIVIED